MRWLEHLENTNVHFTIEILQPNDSIIITSLIEDPQIMIILNGFIQTIQIFTNGEMICTQLLRANNIIKYNYSINKPVNNYYKTIAITKTAILSIPLKELKYKKILFHQLTKIFKQLNNHNYLQDHAMIQILSHKNAKKRIIQLLLILAKEFGQIKNKTIIIPFYLSHRTLSIITGSHRVTITRIMNQLKHKKIIFYNNQNIIIYHILSLSQY